jgi:putative cell wall-binding protein
MIAAMTRRLRPVLVAGLLSLPVVPFVAAPAGAADPVGIFDGDPATTERLPEGEPSHAAVDISATRFAAGAASHVVLSRDDSYADSVAGSGLTGDGPLLFTSPDRLSAVTGAEIDRVIDPGDTVYLLGGTAAISAAVAADVEDAGYDVVRLAGRTRVGTALAVADEVRRLHPDGADVLLARADGWADSVTGGGVAAATDTPVLITSSATLHPAVAAWLAADDPASTTLLGGTAALSSAVERAVPNARRVSGTDRTATATAVADELWPGATKTRYVVTQGAADNSWTFGFAAAGLAADADAPVLLVTDEVTDATADVVSTCGEPAVDLAVVGDGGVVPAALREQLDAADGLACGPDDALVYPSDLTAFPECASLLDWFQQAATERVGPYGLGGFGTYGRGEPIPVEEGDGTGGAPTPTTTVPDAGEQDDADSGGDEIANDSSGTNVQEEGVDEPDIVKTDGEHAYVVAQNELHVVTADGGAPQVVGTLDLPDDGSSELLLVDDRLLVLTRHWSFVLYDDFIDTDAALIAPGELAEAKTTLTYVDVSNPAAPTVTSQLELDGDYRSARMVGSVARLVVQGDPSALPFTYPSEPTAEAEQAAAEHNRQVIADTTLDDWLPSYAVDGGADAALLDCADVHRPPLFSGLGTLSVVTVDVASGVTPTSSAAVLAAGETVYASADRLFVTTGRWDWQPGALGSTVTTEVHGFDITAPTATTYVGSGSVDGYVLNQFALSEHEGNLRIATTTEPSWSDAGEQIGQSESMVTVLAEQGGALVPIGHLGGLGLDERIYAVRWFGDVGAVVTFRQVDPLYLLDLSDPTNPRVSGELKIPGFSAYLHRVDDTHLLGIGSEADEEGRVTGAAVSLFDISDVSAPTLVDKEVYANGYSQVAYDHHAFLHWRATGLAVLPLELYSENGSEFLGAVGLDVDAAGLTEVGRTSHFDDASSEQWWPMISRSFVSNGALYTVSDVGIEQANLATLAEEGFAGF